MWRFALLEIYTKGDKWPKGDGPAQWIEDNEVFWCSGYVPDFVTTFSLWQLLWWKLKGWLGVR